MARVLQGGHFYTVSKTWDSAFSTITLKYAVVFFWTQCSRPRTGRHLPQKLCCGWCSYCSRKNSAICLQKDATDRCIVTSFRDNIGHGKWMKRGNVSRTKREAFHRALIHALRAAPTPKVSMGTWDIPSEPMSLTEFPSDCVCWSYSRISDDDYSIMQKPTLILLCIRNIWC